MTLMDRARLDRILRWIERGLVVLGASCLIRVGAIGMDAVTYQAEQNARLARLGASTGQLAADRALDRVVQRDGAALPIGRLEIPRIGFRPIRRLQTGDEIRLVTPRGTFRYRASRQVVVEADELWVLDATPTAALTLITCYPFDFVGPASRRFVVHAERVVEASEARARSDGRPEESVQ